MEKFRIIGMILLLAVMMIGCGSQENIDEAANDETKEPATVVVETIEEEPSPAAEENVDVEVVEDEAKEAVDSKDSVSAEESVANKEATAADDAITDEIALSAIKNYCFKTNPDLKDMAEKGEYNVSWDIESRDDKEIVVLYRSYTAAEVRYYIDIATGDTTVTEFVKGITPEEAATGESFNIKDYITAE